jgi:hypothetical protein
MAAYKDQIIFESEHHYNVGRTRVALARAMARMPKAAYARGGTHVPSFMDDGRPRKQYHAFFCDSGESPAAVRDFVLQAYPKAERVHIWADAKALVRYRLPVKFMSAMCTDAEKRAMIEYMECVRVHEHSPDKRKVPAALKTGDIVILDDVEDTPELRDLLTGEESPPMFVFVFRRHDALRSAVMRDARDFEPHDPSDAEVQYLADRDRRESGRMATFSGRHDADEMCSLSGVKV